MLLRVPALLALLAALAPAVRAQELLITPQQLSRELRDPSLVILQVGPKDEYEAGHVPGARLITMNDVAAPRTPNTPVLELPDEATLRQKLESFGISDNSRIVVIPGADWISPATRIVWTLYVSGLGNRTRVLDGGSGAWKRAGLPVSKEAPAAALPGRITLPQDRSLVVDHTWVQSQKPGPTFRLIDARDPVFFEGPGRKDGQHEMKAGHIPGAKSFPFGTVTNDSLLFLPVAELRAMFAARGVNPGDTVVGYCHIGQQATAMLFAARLAGFKTKLYDGSFTDWEARKLPIENEKP